MVTLVEAGVDYHKSVDAYVGDLKVDSHYEAKCVKFLQPGDGLWVVGIRESELQPNSQSQVTYVCGNSLDFVSKAPDADFFFSCPPYGDLEVYSNDPDDLSTMSYQEFLGVYRDIIYKGVKRLKNNRFAAFVVGDFRDKKTGNLYGFPEDTVQAFRDAGMQKYNEGIFVTPAGSLPARVSRHFDIGHKFGKTHQNLLVFVKGDAKLAMEAIKRGF
jgi:hypothetical protein